MVRVLVTRPAQATTMAVTTEDGKRYTLYSAARGFEFGEVARFGNIDREGLKPLTRNLGAGLKTLSFSHTIASLDYQQSIEHFITPLMRLARDGKKIRIVGGSTEFEQGVWWNIKALPLSGVQRAKDNRISRATLSWSLEEWVDVTANIVRVIPAPPPAPAPAPAPARTHRVVPGDTLWGIATAYLGAGIRWPEIYALNSALIRDPHWIFPGQVFRIPAR